MRDYTESGLSKQPGIEVARWPKRLLLLGLDSVSLPMVGHYHSPPPASQPSGPRKETTSCLD